MFEDCRAPSAQIHPSALLDAPCRVGEHTAILPFVHVMSQTIIGNHSLIGHNVTIASGVLVGNHVRVLNNSLLNSGVILEDSVYCGPSTTFCAMTRMRGTTTAISRVSPTLVRRGASIGPNSTVAAGVTIGTHAFVEAGTVIDRNIPDFALVCGNPLRFFGWRCTCGEPLTFKTEQTTCNACGKQYDQIAAHQIAPQSDASPLPEEALPPTCKGPQPRDSYS